MKTARQILDSAREYIEINGHHKGDYYGPGRCDNPPACALGALFAQCGGEDAAYRSKEAVKALRLLNDQAVSRIGAPGGTSRPSRSGTTRRRPRQRT